MFTLGEAVAKVSPLDDLGQDVAVFPVGPVPCHGLTEAECIGNASCQPISGTLLADGSVGYVGCATLPITCAQGGVCAQDPVSGSCATLSSTCMPDGWVAVATEACSAALCEL
jgi:hypothetical protein